MAESGLTEAQSRFVREYAAKPNATRAYLRAFGFDVAYTTARSEACRLLTNPSIAAEIAAARAAYMRKVDFDAVRWLRGVVAIATADPDDYFKADPANGGLPMARPWGEIPPSLRPVIQGVRVKRRRLLSRDKEDATDWEVEEVEYKFPDKLAAFDKLARHLGLFKDLPLLEVVLGLFPPELRESLRQSLAAALPAAPGPGGGRGTGPLPPAAGGADARPPA